MKFIDIVLEGMTLNSVASLFGVRLSTLFIHMKRETTDNRQEAFHKSMMLIKWRRYAREWSMGLLYPDPSGFE
jgi:hypothetical protein